MHFKNGRSVENVAYAWKAITLKVMVASRPKFSFCWMATPFPEIMDSCGMAFCICREMNVIYS
jgi:hypothetical protein